MKNALISGLLVLGTTFGTSAFSAENVMDSRTYMLDQSNKERTYPDHSGPYVEVLIEYVVTDEVSNGGRIYDYFRFTVTPLVALTDGNAGIASFGFNTMANACPFGGVIPLDQDSLPANYGAYVSPCYGNNNNRLGGFGKFDAMPSAWTNKDIVEILSFEVEAFDYDHDNDASTPSIPLPIDAYAVAGEGGKEGAWSFAAEVIGIDGSNGDAKKAIFAGHP